MNPIDISSSDTDSDYASDDENPEIVDPSTALTISTRDMNQSKTRALPSSFYPSATRANLSGNGETLSLMNVSGRRSYDPAWPSAVNHQNSSSGLEIIQRSDLHQSEDHSRMGRLGKLPNYEYEKDHLKPSERRMLPSSIDPSATRAKLSGNGESLSQMNVSGRPFDAAGPSVVNHQKRSSGVEMMHRPNLHHSEDHSKTGQQGKLPKSDYERDHMKQAGRRAVSSSFHPSATRATLSGNGESSSGMNISGRPYDIAGPSAINHQKFMRNDVINGVDSNRSRVLPASLVYGVAASFGRHPGPSENSYPSSRNSEERTGGPDETSVYREVVQGLNQPKLEHDIPDGLLSVPLLRHQKIALAWMLQKEARINCVGGILADDQGLGKTVSTIALIQVQRFLDLKSKFDIKNNHNAEALTLDEDADKGDSDVDIVCKNGDSEVISSDVVFSKQRPAAGTLIVCPASVLRQWSRELNDKVDPEAQLNTLVYHGHNRTKNPLELAKYDVVLTTYAIVKNEVPKQSEADDDDGEQMNVEKSMLSSDRPLNKKRKKPASTNKGKKKRKGTDSCSIGSDEGALARVRWLRVVLDEAQTIKNHRTQVARACCGLRAKRRWCLSGTPIQNSISDLFSYFKFLKYDPYSSYKAFIETIKAPISRDSDIGYKKLQIILKNVMLRRTKDTKIDGKPVIILPPKCIQMKSVNFTMEERAFYMQLETDSRSQFKAYAAAGTVSQNYASILLMLLRLRQACDHPFLVYGFSSETFNNTASIRILKQCPKDMLFKLLGCLESSPICQACQDTPEDAVVAMCGHVFCYQCLLDRLEGDNITCPAHLCKEQLSTHVVFSKASIRSRLSDGCESSRLPNNRGDNDNSQLFTRDYSSSKIKAALGILKSLNKPSIDLDGLSRSDGDTPNKIEVYDSSSNVNVRTEVISSSPSQGPIKAILFSQWTRMLDLLEAAVRQSDIQYRRLDGSMSLAVRDKAVGEFNSDPEVTVMLMSLKAGNLGLNMVAACHVILLDLWWNPTTEDQAIDRAHRIGQTRPVSVSRLTVKDTVEDRILALQEEKRKMIASAFGEENDCRVVSHLSAEDLRYLFMG